jgi:hypothetical protein
MCLLWAVDLYIEVNHYMHYLLMGKMTNNNYVNANRTSTGLANIPQQYKQEHSTRHTTGINFV